MDLIKRLWRGDESLVTTYWLYGVGVSVLINLLFLLVAYNAVALTRVRGHEAISPVLVVLAVAYAVYSGVAIWRSAGKYQGARIWSVLARVAVVVGALSWIGPLFAFSQALKYDNEALSAIAQHANISLPLKLDDVTQLDQLVAGDRQLTYQYSTTMASSEIDPDMFRARLSALLHENACREDATKQLLKNGVTLRYVYFANDGKTLAQFVLLPDHCDR